MVEKYTLILNKRTMSAGGIEVYVFQLIKFILSIGGRVIWLCDPIPQVSDQFRHLMIEDRVEMVRTYCRGLHWFKHDPICFENDEHIVILSFSQFDMAQAIHFQKRYPNYNINIFYCVANFTGNFYFSERYLKGLASNIAYRYLKRVMNIWETNSNIRFFSQKHIDAYEKNYQLTISDSQEKLLKSIVVSEEFDNELARKRSERTFFNLITVGRFDFPHKGYMLGLIRSYGRLKEKYSQLTLTIVGYGPDFEILQNEIGKLEKTAQKDIYLTGEVGPDDLKSYFDKVHMNISVAGAVRAGAKCGLLSMNARHYSYDCEVYGFLPESKNKALSTEPGEPVDKYIDIAINATASEYIELCKKSYDTYAVHEADPMYIFKTKNRKQIPMMTNTDITKMKVLTHICKIANKMEIISKRYTNNIKKYCNKSTSF